MERGRRGFSNLMPSVLTASVAPAAVEPFEIHQTEFDRRGRQLVPSFCKTEHAPYDLCVQLALIVFKHPLGHTISVASDGKDTDWKDAPRNLAPR